MPTNALADEKSPYLRQHAQNPVNWLPWGEAAFRKAKLEDKPIFLSVGYSTCHWCHVMAHESFEDERVAEELNAHFVPIKVDREERPDVDRIYMLFVQATTGSGGWPMSVWLTPDLKPFLGGTYFPPRSMYGRPGFVEVLQHVARVWEKERDRVVSSSANVAEQLSALTSGGGTGEIDEKVYASAFWQFRRSFDREWGGFGPAPKFPRPVIFNYLLQYHARTGEEEALDMSVKTLLEMARGGMHDHLGGGFHRYSVDGRWFVPHFEKMLYDQAQLASSYLDAYQITKDEKLAEIARGIFDYVLRDLTDSEGGFYSAEDADSPDPDKPGHSREGAFYVWKRSEIEGILDKAEADLFCFVYGVERDGNVMEDPHGEFAGQNILFHAHSVAEAGQRFGLTVEAASGMFRSAREKLLRVRSRRPRPHLDNKILTAWNSLMISAFAKGFAVLGNPEYLTAAVRAADFLVTRMYDRASGQLLRRYCENEAAVRGFVDDYAFLAQALLDLFEVQFDPALLKTAIEITQHGMRRFEDASGGFFSTEENESDLLVRLKDDYDGAEPSGNSIATDVLLRLANLTGDNEFRKSAEASLRNVAPKLDAQPTAAPQMLAAAGRWLSEPKQIVIRCQAFDTEIQGPVTAEWRKFSFNRVVIVVTDDNAPKLTELAPFIGGLPRKGRATVYACKNFTCEIPKVIE